MTAANLLTENYVPFEEEYKLVREDSNNYTRWIFYCEDGRCLLAKETTVRFVSNSTFTDVKTVINTKIYGYHPKKKLLTYVREATMEKYTNGYKRIVQCEETWFGYGPRGGFKYIKKKDKKREIVVETFFNNNGTCTEETTKLNGEKSTRKFSRSKTEYIKIHPHDVYHIRFN